MNSHLRPYNRYISNISTNIYLGLDYLENIDYIDLNTVSWKNLKFYKYNRSYEMLLNICYFIYQGLIQTQHQGKYKMMEFDDEHMSRLYEKFILEYYRQEYQNLNVSSSEILWDISEDVDAQIIKFLPKMKSDIIIYNKNNHQTLIIDAKYYSNTLQSHFDKQTFHSQNLYQIFTYVKNYDKTKSGNVRGLLLYAKSDIDLIGAYDYPISGNVISVRTLDLNTDFKIITKQLDEIIRKMVLCTVMNS